MTDAATGTPRPYQDTPEFSRLLLYAQAEARTRHELLDVEEVAADLPETERGDWDAYAATLRSRLAQQERDTDACAARLLGHDLPPAELLAAEARALTATPRRARPPRTDSGPRHVAPCPACKTTVRQGKSTTHEPHLLPINPALTDQPYLCPCPRRETLTVGRTARGTWTLQPWTPGRDAREEINAIAHALVAGQVHPDRRHREHADTAPDPSAQRMEEAFRVSERLSRQSCAALLAGHPQEALELAEQHNAALYAYKLHARTYRRQRRETFRTGRWHHGEVYWLDLVAHVRAAPGTGTASATHALPKIRLPQAHRFEFEFLAVYDEQTGQLRVENGPDIERESGVVVGDDGWQQLIDLLSRIDPDQDQHEKPGAKADLTQLIYRDDRGTLTLRAHIATRYPRAVVALEALRRTLVSPERRKARAAWPLSTAPDWVEELPLDTPPQIA